MKSYLIEIPHSENKNECQQAIQVFLESGSHVLSNAEWGCEDGVHKAWILVELESKDEAMQIIPPLFRHKANIIELTRYNKDQMIKNLAAHKE